MVAGQTATDRQRPPVRLYLMITAAVPARPQADALAVLLAEFDVAAVLVRLAPAAERDMIKTVKQLRAGRSRRRASPCWSRNGRTSWRGRAPTGRTLPAWMP